MKIFADQQDDTRFLEIIETKGKNTVCKVFFNEAKPDETRRLLYSGKVTIASHLLIDAFTGTYRDRVSFVAV